jgi:RNA polymerase sigma-70 factor (ECF subfamily)
MRSPARSPARTRPADADAHRQGEEPSGRFQEKELVEALRAGDEVVFATLVKAHSPVMRRIALGYVSSAAVADEVVQEAWLAFLTSLERFEGRSSLKTWILRILIHTAQKRRLQEGHCKPFSALSEECDDHPSVAPERFLDSTERWAGHWASSPRSWGELPEDRVLSQETLAVVSRSIAGLPPNQRAVIELRDVQGWDCQEVCGLLDISEGNQRVLLHRARSKVRQVLEEHLGEKSVSFAP